MYSYLDGSARLKRKHATLLWLSPRFFEIEQTDCNMDGVIDQFPSKVPEYSIERHIAIKAWDLFRLLESIGCCIPWYLVVLCIERFLLVSPEQRGA